MLVAGGAVKGKQLISHWKDLSEANLNEGRDLPVTTDYREVFSQVLKRHLKVAQTETIFPGFAARGPALRLF